MQASVVARAVLVVLIASCALTVVAGEAHAGQDGPTVSLRQLPGRAGCWGPPSSGELFRNPGCSVLRGRWGSLRVTDGSTDVPIVDAVMSADGRLLYVAIANLRRVRGSGMIADSLIVTLRRNAKSGTLRPMTGTGRCVSVVGARDGCRRARGIGGLSDLELAPGGGELYAASSSGIAVFALGRGTLRQLRGRSGCLRLTAGEGCERWRTPVAARYVDTLIAEPSGRFVYALAEGSSKAAWTVVRRDRKTGALRQDRRRALCLAPAIPAGSAPDGCRSVALLDRTVLAFAPDGTDVYSPLSGAVAHLRLDARTGELAPERAGPCQDLGPAARVIGGCAAALLGQELPEHRQDPAFFSLPITPDGRHVYAVQDDGKIVAFERDRASGDLHRLTPTFGCEQAKLPDSCSRRGLWVASDIAFDRRGAVGYVAFDEGLLAMRRDRRTGTLTPVAGSGACALATTARASSPLRFPCGKVREYGQFPGVMIAPDGRFAYIVDDAAIAIVSTRAKPARRGIDAARWRDPAAGLSCATSGKTIAYNGLVRVFTAHGQRGNPPNERRRDLFFYSCIRGQREPTMLQSPKGEPLVRNADVTVRTTALTGSHFATMTIGADARIWMAASWDLAMSPVSQWYGLLGEFPEDLAVTLHGGLTWTEFGLGVRKLDSAGFGEIGCVGNADPKGLSVTGNIVSWHESGRLMSYELIGGASGIVPDEKLKAGTCPRPVQYGGG